VNREKREERSPGRVVAGGFADTDEALFGKRLRMPGIFLEGIQILGLNANEGVNYPNQRLVGGPGIVRRRDNKTRR
jgi:hypothetical protein